tara:strand:+ start:5103 stop:5207 length:105 start_codon:yes stop_codon:yes gene_type:complete
MILRPEIRSVNLEVDTFHENDFLPKFRFQSLPDN